jgi:hypothetical protein
MTTLTPPPAATGNDAPAAQSDAQAASPAATQASTEPDAPKRRRRRIPRGRKGSIGAHERCSEIEADLARGLSLRTVATKYGVSPWACHRHYKAMRKDRPEIVTALAASGWSVKPEELEQLRTETADGWLHQARALYGRLSQAMDACLLAADYGRAAQLASQANGTLRLIGQSVRELGTHSMTVTNNVVLAPGFLQLRSDLLKVLRRHPDAAAAVIATFRKHEGEAFGPATSSAPMIEHSREAEHAGT